MALALFFDPPSRYWGGDDGRAARRRTASESGGAETSDSAPPGPADGATIDALRAGDATVFATLYSAYAPAVHEFVQRYVSSDVANDVVQDVFLSLWRRRESIVVLRSLRAYLFGAARLRALQYRRNAKHGEVARAEVQVRVAVDTGGPVMPTDLVEHAELRAAVSHALMTLPGRTRELLALRWVYGLSYAEAAAVLGVSADAAKKLGRRAEVALAPLLEHFRP